jgi:rod shape-determining protein MreC
VVFVDRGSTSGIESGMAVVTPDGIVGKVVDAYPMASLVMLVTDPTFAAGVISQKNRVRGTLKGLGQTKCLVDYAQNEEKVDEGEWFYTSGDDRIFPRGFPVGQVTSVHNGKTFKEIYLVPSGMQGGVEEVLIMLEGQHLQIPDSETATPGYKILPAPTEAAGQIPQPTGQPTVLTTDADRLREQYKQTGEAQHKGFGEGFVAPDFTKIQGIRASTPSAGKTLPPGRGSETTQPTQQTPSTRPIQPPSLTQPPQPTQTARPTQPPPPTERAQSTQAAQPSRDREGAPPPKPLVSETPTKAAATAPPKPKPHPTTPILVTDPADADPDAVPPPSPKTDKPVKPTGNAVPPTRPSGNQ